MGVCMWGGGGDKKGQISTADCVFTLGPHVMNFLLVFCFVVEETDNAHLIRFEMLALSSQGDVSVVTQDEKSQQTKETRFVLVFVCHEIQTSPCTRATNLRDVTGLQRQKIPLPGEA